MTDEQKKEIKEIYQSTKRSIQDIARIYRMDVHEVLEIIGESRLGQVHTEGDMIDVHEVGPNTTLNHGETFRVPFSTN